MDMKTKIAVVAVLLVAVGVVVAVKQGTSQSGSSGDTGTCCGPLSMAPSTSMSASGPSVPVMPDLRASTSMPATGPSFPVMPDLRAALPRLVDLGRATCIPCKMMAPILADLQKQFQGRLQVEVIDLRDNVAAGQAYNLRVIPTQIFFDASGGEVFRHEGFIGKDDILAKWKELGIDLNAAPSARATPATFPAEADSGGF